MAALILEDNGIARISTSFPYTKIKQISSLNLPALHRTHSAGSSVASTSASATPSEKEGRCAISRDEPCFVTKRPGYSLEKVHLVKAVRNDKSLKDAVEFFLSTSGIASYEFNLNCASNMIPLDRTLHYSLDKLGLFAITCSKATLLALLKKVKQRNRIHDQYDNYRYFNFDEALFSNAKYEMVILHPHHFLPVGSGIAMHTKDPNDPPNLDIKVYRIAKDGALREGKEPTSPRFSAFSFESHWRASQHHVNPFLVVLNAHMAFRRFLKLEKEHYFDKLCEEYQELVTLTVQLADELYHPSVITRIYEPDEVDEDGNEDGNEDEDGDGGEDGGMNLNATDESGAGTGADTATTTRPEMQDGRADGTRRAAKYSRLGEEVNRPGPGASPEEIKEYLMYIMSGRDNPLDRHDEATLRSIGLHPEDSDNKGGGAASEEEDENEDEDPQVPGFMEKVSTWQSEAG